MLGKLLKYDLKYMLKAMGVFYILLMFFAVLTRIFFSLEQTVFIYVMGQITVGCVFAMIANIIINTVMRSWVRFKGSIYGDESYLTHTLPVSKISIYESKFLLTLVYQLVGFVFIILGLFIAYYTEARWDMLVKFINDTSGVLNMPVLPFIIGIIVILYLEIFNMIQCGYLGMIVANKRNDKKVGFSILFGFIAYLLTQVVAIIAMVIVGLFNENIMSIFKTTTLSNIEVVKTVVILGIIFYSLINVVINILCVKKLNEGVNVE